MISLAAAVSQFSHAAVGQRRKYTGEMYHIHPAMVAEIVAATPGSTPAMVAAAHLHDVLEDTQVGLDSIYQWFGREVSGMVWGLTNKSRPHHGNRATRVAIDRAALELQSAEVQTIKLADLIDNTSSIVKHDPKFAVTYLAEKAQLLSVLTKAHPRMIELARASLESSLRQLKETP